MFPEDDLGLQVLRFSSDFKENLLRLILVSVALVKLCVS